MKITVLGLGNTLYADEGFGVEATRRLEADSDFEGKVEFVDGGTQGIYLLDFIKSADRLLIFDAIIPRSETGMETDAKFYVYRNEEIPAIMHKRVSSHQSGLGELLSIVQLEGQMPEEIVLIGVLPRNLNMEMGLSPEVESLMPDILSTGKELVDKWVKEGAS